MSSLLKSKVCISWLITIKQFYHNIIRLEHLVEIEASSNHPLAGSNYSLICTVISDLHQYNGWTVMVIKLMVLTFP